MRDQAGFDQWAGDYEQDVRRSEGEGEYPFAGYGQVHDAVCAAVLAHGTARVLDLGFGTGRLTARLYAGGCRIWGLDFSEKMIRAARARMPEARLFQGDFREGLPEAIRKARFDCIVATYALHHLPDAQKPAFLQTLWGLLDPGGELLIGDIAFPNRAALEACRARSPGWDAQEFYFVLEELAPRLPFPLEFRRLSLCAGLLRISRGTIE